MLIPYWVTGINNKLVPLLFRGKNPVFVSHYPSLNGFVAVGRWVDKRIAAIA
ncbi:MAG: hypothetical protein ICV55_12005 [Coleofasciculus sp. C3-bin4]|nr:hypothetical protein [Coleofasciculus sp. C3-bin4]